MTDAPAPARQPLPSRVVDTHNQGWYLTGSAEGPPVYQAAYGFQRDLAVMPYGQLAACRGPLRPVLPVTDADEDDLAGLFDQAGRKTVTTIAAALEVVFHEIREEQGGLFAPGSYAYARRTMLAGREGSWESEVLMDLVLFGNGLNLLSPVRRTPEEQRADGPNGRRVDKAARDAMAVIFRRWVTDPDRYTEVAATLAYLVSGYCDKAAADRGLVPEWARSPVPENLPLVAAAERERAVTGWRVVADQWLMPGTLAKADFGVCYRLLYSVSANFDSSLIP